MTAAEHTDAAPTVQRALAWSTVGSVGSRVVGAVGGVLAARALTAAARGDLAILVVIATIASTALAAGVQFWVAREIAASGSVHVARAVAHRHCLVVTAVGLGSAALAAPLLVGNVLGADTYAATVALAVTGTWFLVILAIPSGERAMGRFAAAMTVSSIVYAGGLALAALTDVTDVATVLWLAVAGNVIGVLVARARRMPPTEAAGPHVSSAWRASIRFGAAGGLSELVLFGMLRVDVLLLAAFRPAAEVGAYAVATSLTEMLWIASDATAHVALPTAAARNEDEFLPAMFRLTMLVGIIAGVGMTLVAGPLIAVLFGDHYRIGAAAVPYLAAAAVVGGGWKILSAEVTGRSGPRPRLRSAGIGLAVMVLVDLLVIPGFGIRGAGIGALAGYSAAAAVLTQAWRAEAGHSIRMLVGVRSSDLALLHRRSSTLEQA